MVPRIKVLLLSSFIFCAVLVAGIAVSQAAGGKACLKKSCCPVFKSCMKSAHCGKFERDSDDYLKCENKCYEKMQQCLVKKCSMSDDEVSELLKAGATCGK